MNVFVFGAGKVGLTLGRALRKAGFGVRVRAARKGVPKRHIDARLILLAVRDSQLESVALSFATAGVIDPSAVVVHHAGARGSDVLAALRSSCAGVAQMHPLLSFASTRNPPSLTGAYCLINGDPQAIRRASSVAKRLGMKPWTSPELDTVAYHTAAGLVANGAAALAAVGAEWLMKAGVAKADAPVMLAALLRSVAMNVGALGFPEALTGPVRRGDATAVARQIALIRATANDALPLFVELIRAQLPLARALAEASDTAFDAIARLTETSPTRGDAREALRDLEEADS